MIEVTDIVFFSNNSWFVLSSGRYVGSRPIKLRKSSWKNRSLDVVRKKEKEKAALISLLTSGPSKPWHHTPHKGATDKTLSKEG